VFQADDCDAFDYDVDEAPTTQTMFMANLSSADPVYDEVGPVYSVGSGLYPHVSPLHSPLRGTKLMYIYTHFQPWEGVG
ncbi:hypothetical protein Tco_0061367, partial [Tanacetum coccineum]